MWKLRVQHCRKYGHWTLWDRKIRLIVKLRGFGAVFHKRRIMRLPKVNEMTSDDRREYLANRRVVESRYWYTRTYMVGSGGLNRRQAIRMRMFRVYKRKMVRMRHLKDLKR